MRVGSLFTGLGGFDLGFERAGLEIAWQCEINPYRRAVLRKHWPDLPLWPDIKLINGTIEPVDVLCGGFPCTDISEAGNKAGIQGTDSNLWFEFSRVIRLLRPRYVVVENVAALLWRGVEEVLVSLAKSGYDAEWDCLPASTFGAPHRRERIWIVAYPSSEVPIGSQIDSQRGESLEGSSNTLADPRPRVFRSAQGFSMSDPLGRDSEETPWSIEPPVGRMADRVPNRVERLTALGDSLVPQIAEWLGHRLLAL